jgi:hypothetical protein
VTAATLVRYGDPGVGKTEVILRETTRYDDYLVPIPVRPRYGSWNPANEEHDNMMMVIGYDAETDEGRLRSELLNLLAQAVGETAMRPGTGNTDTIRTILDEALILAVRLDMLDHEGGET